jgi:ankyrin repeat protein
MPTTAQEMLSAVLAGDEHAVGALLDADPQLCNLTDRSPERLSVLHHAAGRGQLAIVELLLAAGATVDRRSHDGSTPLHAAAAGGHLEVVRTLLTAGADPAALTNSGRSPWSAANHRGHRAVADTLRDLRIPGAR